jgi:adenine-specific DNA glycosylase
MTWGGAMARRYEYEEYARKVAGYRRPLSPLMLIQECVPSRWAALVGAVMCCRTGRKVSHPCTWDLLFAWPTPMQMSIAEPADVAKAIRRAGLADARARNLVTMSREWLLDTPVGDLPGVGQYVEESDRVFGLGDLSFNPADGELQKFVWWARSATRRGDEWRTPWSKDHGRQ